MGILKGVKILVVEDDYQSQKFMQQFFEEEECEIKIAEDGVSALKTIENFEPDCILLDIMLPQMDGIQALKKIRKKLPNVMVIMTTGVSSLKAAKECLNAGAHTFITKPVDFLKLQKVITEALGLQS